MDRYNLVSFAGIFVLVSIAWAFSTHRNRVNFRVVAWGILLQLIFGVFVFLMPLGTRIILAMNDAMMRLMNAATDGIGFCFGPLAVAPGRPGSLGFILAIQGLATIVFFTALMEILYFFKIMPFVIRQFARVFTRLMGVSGAESLCTASNVFVGIESAATVLPYLKNMTRSELCTVLTAGLATIASSVMGLYVLLLRDRFPQIAGHLMSASLLSAPAALVLSKLLLPETEQPETLGSVVAPHYEKKANLIEAIVSGATAGGKLTMGVLVMLMAFLGLVSLANMGLGGLSSLADRWTGFAVSFRLEDLLAWVYYPFALIVGVPPSDAFTVARLLGIRTIMTEVPAYQQLSQLIADGAFHHGRSVVLASYALCGFSHVASLATFVGGISALAPGQTQTLSQIAFRSLAAATLACLMTAAVAGTFYGHGTLLFTSP